MSRTPEDGRRVYIFDQDLKNFVQRDWFEESQVGEQVLFTLDQGKNWNEGIVERENEYGRAITITRSQGLHEGDQLGIGYEVPLVPTPKLDEILDKPEQIEGK